MPAVLKALCRRLVRWRILPPDREPDTAIVNVYDTGARRSHPQLCSYTCTLPAGCTCSYSARRVSAGSAHSRSPLSSPGCIGLHHMDSLQGLLGSACCAGGSGGALLSSAGDCIPPHIDHHDFVRPFVTVSLQSEQEILFSERIISLDAGVFSGRFKMPLPPGAQHATTNKHAARETG